MCSPRHFVQQNCIIFAEIAFIKSMRKAYLKYTFGGLVQYYRTLWVMLPNRACRERYDT